MTVFYSEIIVGRPHGGGQCGDDQVPALADQDRDPPADGAVGEEWQ